jgi:hypothetical protein
MSCSAKQKYNDDSGIRKMVLETINEKKSREEAIKLQVEEIDSWREVEELFFSEKKRLLKEMEKAFKIEMRRKSVELDRTFGGVDLYNKYRKIK